MSLVNKSFKNNLNGEIVRIVDSYQNIAITDSKEKISTDRLLDTRYYTEYVDPRSFFDNTSTYNLFAEKIKNVDLSNVPDDDVTPIIPPVPGFEPSTNESAVIVVSEEDEIEELKRKYGATVQDTSAIIKQNESLNKIINPDPIENKSDVPKSTKSDLVEKVDVQRVDVQRNDIQKVDVQRSEDPILTMFKNVKRNLDFKLSIDIDGKIPRLDFIEMMEDSYEISIIEYLANDFTEKLFSNPDMIKNQIIDEINSMIKGKNLDEKPVVKRQSKPKTGVKSPVKTPVKTKTRQSKKEKEDENDTGSIS